MLLSRGLVWCYTAKPGVCGGEARQLPAIAAVEAAGFPDISEASKNCSWVASTLGCGGRRAG